MEEKYFSSTAFKPFVYKCLNRFKWKWKQILYYLPKNFTGINHYPQLWYALATLMCRPLACGLTLLLKCRFFESETCCLVDAEHEVHILNSLTYSTFKQVVDAGGDEQFVAVFLYMDKRLVGVHHLLQVDGLVAVVGKGRILIEVFVGFDDVFYGSLGPDDCRAEDAAGEIASIGDEVDVGVKIALNLLERLADLGDVLMLEGLVDAQVVVAPGEMGGGSRLLACASTARDGIHGHTSLCSRSA